MATLTAVPVTDLPCPRAAVTVQGLSAGDHVISVWRTSGGERSPVRGARTVRAADSFFIEDFEAPLGREVTYELEVISGVDAGTPPIYADTLIESECGYLQDPLNPSSAVPVWGDGTRGGQPVLSRAAFGSFGYTADSADFRVLGSSRPVSISTGRAAPSGIPLVFRTRSEAETARVRELVKQAPHLVFRPTPGWGSAIPGVATYSAATVEETPVILGNLTRWETTMNVVRPSSARVIVTLWPYQDVAQLFATYDQKQSAAGPGTYLDDQKNPANVI